MIFFKDLEISPFELDSYIQQKEELLLLDVREEIEFVFCKISDSINIPLRNLAQDLQMMETDKPIVTLCHHGVRSLQAAHMLRAHGFDNVASLKGGLDQWARDVSPSMPRY